MNITGNLNKLRQDKRNLSVKTINSLENSVSYGVQQYRDCQAPMQRNLEAIDPNAFGEHVKCESPKFVQTHVATTRNRPTRRWSAEVTV